MKYSIHNILLAVIAVASLMLVSCDPENVAYTEKVEISMDTVPGHVSCGLVEVKCSTNREAYYYVGIAEAVHLEDGSEFDPMSIEQQFMTLALDSAYINYLNWRYDLLKQGREHIADFASHSLQYGDVNYRFTRLKPNTHYWVFSFVVDKELNQPVGNLNIMDVETPEKSIYLGKNAIHFAYRVRGKWDYVYPYMMDDAGNSELVDDVPWLGQTTDSVVIREALLNDIRMPGTDNPYPAKLVDSIGPGLYFATMFATQASVASRRVLYGIYAHNNDGVGDGTTDTNFEEGHTYYTAMSIYDGETRSDESYDIYKFTWQGDSTHFVYMHSASTLGMWDIRTTE